MTLIVGILCENGAALASDRQATNAAFFPLANPNRVQTSTQTITKVTKVGNDTLFAVSGCPPIGIEYESIIKRYQPRFAKSPYEFATKKMKDDIRENINKHLDTAKLLAEVIGPERAYVEATCESMLATNFKDGIRLIQINAQGAFDAATEELPIRVIGSGQMQADPFSVFLRKTFWPDRLPTVEEGVLYAIWTIEYAIDVGAPGVGKGINAFSVSKSGSKAVAKTASSDQITGNLDFIREAKDKLRGIANVRHTTDSDAKKIPTMK